MKLIRVEKVLKALSNNDLNPEILNETFEFILEHKNKVAKEQRNIYMRNWKLKQKRKNAKTTPI